jgi:acyl-CoA thioester hydrolase
MAVIHHSNYIRWFEEARTDFMNQLGMGIDKLEKLGIITPVLAVSCQYKSMVHFNDAVLIIPRIESYNGIKLCISYRIIDKDTKRLMTTGQSEHCFLNRKKKLISLRKNFIEIDEMLKSLAGKEIINAE